MQATRQHILDTLDQRGSATAQQLAQAFGLTAASMRRHLAILRSRDLVARVGKLPPTGRGRPIWLYALTPAAQGASYENLVRALLSNQAANPPTIDPQIRLNDLARRLLGEPPAPTGQLTKRLVAAIQRLAPLNYKPHWEAKPHGPELVLGRCPYATIIGEHPELCRMDASMLSTLLGAPVEQTAKLQPGPHAIPQCVFVLYSDAHK